MEQPFGSARIVTSSLLANSGALGAATLMLNQLGGVRRYQFHAAGEQILSANPLLTPEGAPS
ncbi:MAG: hypothetical protein R2855_18010 [Thermomicrobiales bacterium]